MLEVWKSPTPPSLDFFLELPSELLLFLSFSSPDVFGFDISWSWLILVIAELIPELVPGIAPFLLKNEVGLTGEIAPDTDGDLI